MASRRRLLASWPGRLTGATRGQPRLAHAAGQRQANRFAGAGM